MQATGEISSYSRDECKLCGGTGFILKRQYVEMYGYEIEVAAECPCRKQEQAERLFLASKITPAFLKRTLENFVTRGIHPTALKGYGCAKHYIEHFDEIKDTEHNSLALLGEPGAGKTHLICAIANALMKRGIPCLYFPHVEVFSELKTLAHRSGEDAVDDRIRAARSVPVLVWDDLFKGRKTPTDFELEVTFNIVNYRYLNCLPCLWSSERLDSELLEIDKAIGSRIIERSKGHMVIYVAGKDDPVPLNYRLR